MQKARKIKAFRAFLVLKISGSSPIFRTKNLAKMRGFFIPETKGNQKGNQTYDL